MNLKFIFNSVVAIGLLTVTQFAFAQEAVVSSGLDYANASTEIIDANVATLEADGLEKKPKRIPPWFARRLTLSAGVFFPINNTTIEVGNQSGTFGTKLDFEDNLGFKENTTTFLGDIQWRASRRSRFDLSYFSLRRSNSYRLQRDIQFGENTYNINSSVDAYFDVKIYRFTYGYAFFIDPKYEFGMMIGAHILQCDTGISFVGETAEISKSDSFDFTAPLPDVGFWGGYALTDKWALKGNVSYLSVKVNDFTGKIVSYNFSVMYQVIPNLDLCAGYTGMNFTVDVQKERLEGYFKWGYNGPSISASYSFGSKQPFK